MHCSTIALTTACLLAGSAGAAVINVPGDAPTIQVAINIAAGGDEIVVAPGTYFESIDLLGKELTVRSSGGSTVTIIDAFGQFDSAVHMYSNEGAGTVLEGFTIQNGNADGIDDGDPDFDDRGGGLILDGASPTIIDCVFTSNMAAGVGGAVYANDSSPVFVDCRFEGNDGNLGGGAYFNSSTISLAGCVFDQNVATADAGAIRVFGGSATIIDCEFTDNVATNFAGAIGIHNATAGVSIERCRFADNFCGDGGANGRGGAVYSTANSATRVENSVFIDNTVDGYGGALYSGFPMTVVSCTFTGSLAGQGENSVAAGNIATTMTNCLVWGNAGTTPVNATYVASYCNIEGGFAGAGNIDVDPMFVDAAGRNLQLQAGSPCIDAGDTTAAGGSYPTDLAGNPRVVNDPDTVDSGLPFLGLALDIGAYEFQPGPVAPACPGDLDGDDVVGTSDLLQMLAAWGACP